VAQFHFRDSIVLFAFLFLSCVAYSTGLPGGYVFDDFPNIVSNSFVNRESWSAEAFLIAALSGEAGPTGRPVAMFTFALDSFLWDLSPQAMKWENIALHGIVGFLFFCLLERILTRLNLSPRHAYFIALISMLIWVVHPLNLTSVLYIVQRMNLLSTLFALLALLCFVEWRTKLARQKFSLALAIGFGVASGLSIFSKENGILIFLYVLLIEVFVFSSGQFVRHERTFQRLLLAGLAIVCCAVWYVVISEPTFIARGYSGREFTIDQRLLTEFRVVSWYIFQLFSPSLQEMSLYHDDIVLSDGLLTPISTLLSSVFIFLSLFAATLARKRHPIISLSVFMFFASQLIESFTMGLEVAYEHRVYFGGGWLIVAAVYLVALLIRKLNGKLQILTVCFSAIFATLIMAFQTQARAEEWSSAVGLVFTEVKRNPDSYRANVMAGSILASRIDDENRVLGDYFNYISALGYFEKAMSVAPSQASACIAALILETRYYSSVPGDDSIQKCSKALSRAVDSSSTNSLGLLVNCVASGKCEDGDYVLSLLDHAYDSFNLRNEKSRAILLADRANYYADVKNDLLAASLILRRAIEIYPAAELNYIKLIDVWIRIGNLVEAQRTGQALMKIDSIRKYASVYEALEITRD
jgi:tetratricopeptide (TPR) repeat protein